MVENISKKDSFKNEGKSAEEHKYTSTGIKFWKHMFQMESYRKGGGDTIISTHISPTSKCNLNCSYCSVKKREKSYEIEPEKIINYVDNLKERGLKAVIFTGGGEPTIYPYFNDIMREVSRRGLNTALITNGTLIDKVASDVWNQFSWVRISINDFPNWEKKISSPKKFMNEKAVLGASFIYTGQKEDELKTIGNFANQIHSEYVRLLPNCLLSKEDLFEEHAILEEKLKKLGNPKLFHQFKIHRAPKETLCHQSVFRPYLSEVGGGTIYPCDSVVLNDCEEHFHKKYQLCEADKVLDFLDGKIKQPFNAKEDCPGCVFTDNVEMLGKWKKTGKIPKWIKGKKDLLIKHKNFP